MSTKLEAIMKKLSQYVVTFFVTGGGVGFLPKAPGTWGSLIPVLPLFFLPHFSIQGHILLTGLVVLILFTFGWIGTYIYQNTTKKHDPKEVVIDEILGQMIAILPIYIYPNTENPIFLILAFILFRFFDILKPFPISSFDRMKSAWSVMVDDVIAGLFAAFFLGLFIHYNIGTI